MSRCYAVVMSPATRVAMTGHGLPYGLCTAEQIKVGACDGAHLLSHGRFGSPPRAVRRLFLTVKGEVHR
jgi:hypothetical protein